VVVQSNEFNDSEIRTVLVTCLTTNLSRANAPGNVPLSPGEGDLPEQSVVNVSQTFTMDERDLDDKRGGLDYVRMRDVVGGIRRLLEGARGLP
jgi:mRNA interferase MazF